MKTFLGGYGYSYQSPNSPTSPRRSSVWGSAYSPFRNTNMPIQDTTMDQTTHMINGTNTRSSPKSPTGGPGGNAPGIGTGGRTMKECEDELETLKKANFNLKLRIYFLEERLGVTSSDEGAIKKNIELTVENETLKKELSEKQELLSQAAKAFEMIEEEKDASSRNRAQYQESLDKNQRRIEELENELKEYKDRLSDTSMYYQETLGITPEKALEHQEKLHQMEELVASLESEVKQITASLDEERNWAQELEVERDQFRDRLNAETKLREQLSGELRERIKELEEEAFRRENIVQQQKNELAEKDRLLKEKTLLLEETSRTSQEVSGVAEKRKKQIVQLRQSVKSRDDALTDLNNKHRALLNQFEQNHAKRNSAPSSPLTWPTYDGSRSPRMVQSPSKSANSPFDWEPHRDKPLFTFSHPSRDADSSDNPDVDALSKEIKELKSELERQEEAKKQLILKLCNTKKSSKITEEKNKKLESEYDKGLKVIQALMDRQAKTEDQLLEKTRKIRELEAELEKRNKSSDSLKVKRSGHSSTARRDLTSEMANHPERDHTDQQRFEDMECKINELRDEIESAKAEKYVLERKIQADSKILEEQLDEKQEHISRLEEEKITIKQELDLLKESYDLANLRIDELELDDAAEELERMRKELILKNNEIDEKNHKIELLSKDLQVKTQNLQKLVNTELWSKNKEIAKLHNQTMSANQAQDTSRGNKSEASLQEQRAASQLGILLRELNDIGIKVSFTSEVVQLNHVNGNETIDVKTITEYVQKLVKQKSELEREVDYLRWLKLVAQPDVASTQELEHCGDSENDRARKYCEILRTHVKDLLKFMKEMLKTTHYSDGIGDDHRNIVLDVLVSSKTLYEEFAKTQDGRVPWDEIGDDGKSIRRSQSTELLPIEESRKLGGSEALSDSEAFSEPDRKVSLARIGLQETHKSHNKNSNRLRGSKYAKTFSDSEDSIDYIPYHKSVYPNDVNGDSMESGQQIQQLVETNRLLSAELRALREEILSKVSLDNGMEDKVGSIIAKIDRSQKLNERLQCFLDRRIHEWNAAKCDSKHNGIRKAQLEKKITDVENMAVEISKQKSELLHYKEDTERKAAEMLITLNRENEALRSRIKVLEEENQVTRTSLGTLSKDLDQLTLSHSQVLVENTKLTNDKLRLEQDLRKSESKYDITVRSLHDKFNKEVTDLNQMNDSHRARLEELETANKELRRHVVVCDASDSAPSSSGVSSIPADANTKQTCEDLLQEYHTYNGSQYWLSINYPTSTGRSKSSCSPDLGIESDAAVSTTRPLQDTLKITESMTNLLSDEDYNSNPHGGMRDSDRDSPLHLEDLDEVEALKRENEVLKRRLMKTRRALEDTFQHLSASNKNKKNVEKAITKQLLMTKSILKKTRTYEEPFD